MGYYSDKNACYWKYVYSMLLHFFFFLLFLGTFDVVAIRQRNTTIIIIIKLKNSIIIKINNCIINTGVIIRSLGSSAERFQKNTSDYIILKTL